MLTSRYHLGSLIAIFLALGIGMLIGGLIGERFYSGTESRVLQMLMEKYELRVEQNEQLQQQLAFLQRVQHEAYPSITNKNIVVVSNEPVKKGVENGLSMIGMQWSVVGREAAYTGQGGLDPLLSSADIVITSRRQDAWIIRSRTSKQTDDGSALSVNASRQPIVIDLSAADGPFEDPAFLAGLMRYMEQIMEGSAHETFGIYRYPRVE